MNVTLAQPKSLREELSPSSLDTRNKLSLLMTLVTLVAFVLFNYSIIAFSLKSLLGSIPGESTVWSISLAVGICSLDVTGILRLTFSPGQSWQSKMSKWLLTAWLANQLMTFLITWWGISTAIAIQQVKTGLVIDAGLLREVLPAFLAVMLSLVRLLIIGALSKAFDRGRTTTQSASSARQPGLYEPAELLSFTPIAGGSVVPPHGFIASGKMSKSAHEPTFRHTPVHYRYR